LEASCPLGRHIGVPAIGCTPSPSRGMEGFQMIGMHLCRGNRLGGVGMLWIRGLVLRPFATALMPLRPFILESYFDAFAQGLLRTSSLASPEHFATDLKQETPIAPFTIRQERQITCLLNDLAQESHGVFKELAFLASTVHLPQKTGGPIH